MVGVPPQETWESLFLRGLRQKRFKGRGLGMSFLSRIKEDRQWISRTWFLFLCFFWCPIELPVVKCWLMSVHWASQGESLTVRERPVSLSTESWGESSGKWWGRLLWRGTKGCGCGLWGGRRAISVQDTWLGLEKRTLLNNVCTISHSLGKCIHISKYICIEFSRRVWENYEHRLPLGGQIYGCFCFLPL